MDSVGEVLPFIKGYAGTSGTCSDAKALDYLNKASNLLWNKTDFYTTTDYICVCVHDHCLTLPSAYKQIRLAWIGRTPATLGNEWYQSIPQIGLVSECSCSRQLVDVGGLHVTFRNYWHPYYVTFQAEDPLDAGTELTVFGTDEYGTAQKEQMALGVAPEKINSEKIFKSVVSIIKPKTRGRVRLYATNRNTGEYLLLAIYQPYDVNPNFKRFKVPKTCCEIRLLCKRKFVAAVESNDLVYFPIEALTFAVTAIVGKEARQNSVYVENLQLAIGELNRETADREEPTASPLRLAHSDNVDNLYPPAGEWWYPPNINPGYGGWSA